ncbi:alkane 1-monooxygenase [Defluviimonas sp. SAOS-178_SWC]|uniref:alkane 1-monooxygenase n=1 Tax=Defluviimonas sp. SAOS-178_SWC TaxID=3121287 RepID=UPI00322206CC
MSKIEQSDDAAALRAVISALEGGAEPFEDTAPPPESRAKQPPHLRVVAQEAPAESAKGRVVRPRRPPAPAEGTSAPRDPDIAAIVDAAETATDAPDEAEAVAALVADARPGPDLKAKLAEAGERWRPLRPYLLATLLPVPLLLLAGGFGGVFSLLALLWMTGVLFAIDEIAKRRGLKGPAPLVTEMADRLSVVLAALHFGLLVFAVWALSGGAGFGFFGWIATFLAFGLWFGQVSNSNAHELIHRSDKRLFRLGMWVYISLLFGHHTSAHRLVHHRFVATTDDPNTAAEGENFYLFAARAWPGAFVAGYEMEENLRAKREAGGLGNLNPYTIYIAGALGFVGLMLTLFGFDGLLAYLLLCAHAQMQLLLSDYVQHYGLLRRKMPSGATEPAGLQHSWDAPHPMSGLMMLNAPRHADHHAHPSRPYTELQLSPDGRAPILPYSLPAMATIALIPHIWYRVMHRPLALVRAKS